MPARGSQYSTALFCVVRLGPIVLGKACLRPPTHQSVDIHMGLCRYASCSLRECFEVANMKNVGIGGAEMTACHIMRKCLYISTTLLFLTWPVVLKAELIKPGDPNFFQKDLSGLREALDLDKTDPRHGGKPYNKNTNNCADIARRVQYNLWKNHQIETSMVDLEYTDNGEPGHNHSVLKVTIRDKDEVPTEVYIEAQTDELYYDIENLLPDFRQGHTIENIEILSEAAVLLVANIRVYTDPNDPGRILIGPTYEQEFTVEVYVMDQYRKPAAGQKVTVTITHADGSEDTIEDIGVTDSNGVATGKATTKKSDFLKTIDVEATIHILPVDGEGEDPRDPTGTKDPPPRVVRDAKQSCLPKGLDGVPPNDPIYVSADGQVAQAHFTLYNTREVPVEIQPILECEKNPDGSDVLQATFHPAIVYVEPNDCANVRAEIMNLTAPPGDTIVAKLRGQDHEYKWIFIKVYEPIPQIVIDPFSTPTSPVSFVASPSTVFPWTNGTTTEGSMLGGERDPVLNVLSAETSDGASVCIEDGTLHITQDPTARSRVIIQYDGNDGSWQQAHASDGLGDFDLTDGDTQDGFLIRVLKLESTSSVTMTVIVFTTPADFAEKSVSIAPTAVATDVRIAYSDLFHTGDGADMTKVNAVLVLFGFPAGMTDAVNLVVDGIWTTPKEGSVPDRPEDLKASNPYPPDGLLHRWSRADLSWESALYATSYDVYFSTSSADVNEGSPDALLGNVADPWLYIGYAGCPYPDGLVAEAIYYWVVVGRNDLHPDGSWPGDIWSFVLPPASASYPDPADGTISVDPNAVLAWSPGLDAVWHQVYLGTDADALAHVATLEAGTWTYNPGPLDYATDYYWRVDEWQQDDTETPGDRWRFTTAVSPEDLKASGPLPFSGQIDVDPNMDLSWSSGWGAYLHHLYFGTDANALPLVVKLEAGTETFDPGTLDYATDYYWRVDEEATDGTVTLGDDWSFATAARLEDLKASGPLPFNGQIDVDPNMDLSWSSGWRAHLHHLYFGTDANALPLVVKLEAGTETFDPGPLDYAMDYYWRVDERQQDGTETRGDRWRFTTREREDPKVSNLDPPDGAEDVPTDKIVTWTGPDIPVSYDVYFGMSSPPPFKVNQPEASYAPGPLKPCTTYYYRIDVVVGDGDTKYPGNQYSFTTSCAGTGTILHEVWEGIPGRGVSDLLNDKNYPGNPTHADELPSFEAPTDIGDYFGSRIHGWLYPKTSGDYTFWIASDDASELYLSTSESPADAVRIAFVDTWTSARIYDSEPNQESTNVLGGPIHLEAGQRYYVAALFKEGGGGDHCSVAWQGPDSPERSIIDGYYLSPFVNLWPWAPNPPDGAVVPTDTILDWSPPVTTADQYIVHFGVGSTPPPVADRTEASYDPRPLQENTTYYWRVDAVGPHGTHTGSEWTFTTLGPGPGHIVRQWWLDIGGTAVADLTGDPCYPDSPDGSEYIDSFEGPTDWADNYGTRLSGYLHVPFSGTYTFWIAGDDQCQLWLSTNENPEDANKVAGHNSWTGPRQWDKFPDQKSDPIALIAGQICYIEALMKEGTVGDNIAVAWEGPGIRLQVITANYVGPTPNRPEKAYLPSPPDGAADVSINSTLTWLPGDNATGHKVKFGTNPQNLPVAAKGDLGFESFVPELDLGRTYYWQVVESRDDGTEIQGDTWKFSVADYLIVDDFDDYNDFTPDRIFQTWLDGYGYGSPPPAPGPYYPGNGTGSIVGRRTPPFAEQEIVLGGYQSMRFVFDNDKPPDPNTGQPYLKFSEAMRLFPDAPADWTKHVFKAMALSFLGAPPTLGSFTDNLDGTYTMTASGEDIWDNSDQFHFAYKTLTGPGTIIVTIEDVANTNAWTKAGVMLREDLTAESANVGFFRTPDNRLAAQHRADPNEATDSLYTYPGFIASPFQIRVEREGDTFVYSYWCPMGLAWLYFHVVNVDMPETVFVGLALTSHDAALTTEATFSNVKITGDVSGEWKNRDIGLNTNDAERMYVAVGGDTGPPAVVYHDDPNATQIDTWTEWNIDLMDFANQGVPLNDVRRIYIGFGNRDLPVAGGRGTMYFDDLRLYRGRCFPSLVTPSLADLNSDCVVDSIDLEIMADDWLTFEPDPGVDLEADLNSDCTVNVMDYAVLADQWLEDHRWPNW